MKIVECGIAISQIAVVGESVFPTGMGRFVGNARPGDTIGSLRGETGTTPKGETVIKGVFETIGQGSAVVIVGQVGHARRAVVDLAGRFVILALSSPGNIVPNFNCIRGEAWTSIRQFA